MYFLVLIALAILVASAFAASFFELISQVPAELAASLAVLTAASFLVDWTIRRALSVPWRFESTLITAGILFFVMRPTVEPVGLLGLAVAAGIAVASKYVVVWRGRHLFNPAAFGATALTIIGLWVPALGSSWWWIGTPVLAMPVAALGFLVAWRTEKLGVVVTFLLVAVTVAFLRVTMQSASAGLAAPGPELLWQLVSSGPYLFLGLFMLTEPVTMPPRRRQQLLVAVVVGVLSGWPLLLGSLSWGQEGALLIGNLVAFVLTLSLSRGIRMTVTSRESVGAETTVTTFHASEARRFGAGQYLELTVPHTSPDWRGTRREFSVVSAPADLPTVKIAYRSQSPLSSFKQALNEMPIGGVVRATGIWGDFVLPKDSSKPVAMVAGGIGITPFVSQLREDLATGTTRDVVLIYQVRTSEDALFVPDLMAAGIPVLLFCEDSPPELPENWQWGGAEVSAEAVATLVTDLNRREVYVSGAPQLVTRLRKNLGQARRVRTDAFAGY